MDKKRKELYLTTWSRMIKPKSTKKNQQLTEWIEQFEKSEINTI